MVPSVISKLYVVVMLKRAPDAKKFVMLQGEGSAWRGMEAAEAQARKPGRTEVRRILTYC